MIQGKAFAAFLFAGVSAAALSVPAHAQSEQAAAERQQEFRIAAQSLDTALVAFAEQANVDLLYSPELVEGLQAAPVNGKFGTSQALRQLLTGTGLEIVQVSPNVFSLQKDQNAGDMVGFQSVGGIVTNVATGGALPGAKISVVGTRLSTVSDERGYFYLPQVPAGAARLLVSYLGEPDATFPIPGDRSARQSMALTMGERTTDIVVLGFSSSLARALNQQLRAPNSATIVSSDLLGSFPAETVSEALRRVPGVAFGRADDTGEGSRITVRGFSSEAINIQLNGLDMQGTGFERTIDLSGFLADNISQVTIHKSLLPSHESSGSGGLVEIETKSGLDYGRFTLSLGVEGERNFDRKFGGEYQVNGTLGAKITDNLGVVATVQYRKTDRTNYDANLADLLGPVSPVGFNGTSFVPADRQFPFDEGVPGRLVTGINYGLRNRDEENLTASLNFAWDVSSTTRLRLDLQRIERSAQTETARLNASFLSAGTEMPIPELGGEVRRRSYLTSLRPVLLFGAVDEKIVSDNISFRGETNLERWTFKYKAGYSRARSRSSNFSTQALGATRTDLNALIDPSTIVVHPDDDAARTPRVVDGGVVFTNGGFPILSLSQAGLDFLNNPATYSLSNFNYTLTDSPTQAYILEGSARYQPSLDWFDYIEVGGKYDRSKRKSADENFASTSTGSLKIIEGYTSIAARPTTLDFFGNGLFDSGVISGLGGGGFDGPFLTRGAADTILAALPGLVTDNPATAFNENRFTYADRRTFDPILDTGGNLPASTIEERTAGYFESKFTVGKFELVGGARYERFYRSGVSLTTPTVRTASNVLEPRLTFVGAGLIDFTDLSGAQSVWTPSMILNYRPQSNIVARFAYFRSTVNPDFRMLRRARQVTINLLPATNTATILEANPDLRPTKTHNFDLDLAYYFEDSPGLLRAGLFYKKVKDNFTNVTFLAGADDDVREEILAYFGSLATTRPDLVAFDANTVFQRSRPQNGEGGKIYGVELEAVRQLNFLPGFLKNFTFLGNLTYTKGDFPTVVTGRDAAAPTVIRNFTLHRPLADQAKWVYNTSLSYASGGFEGRLIYTYQSATPDAYEVHGLDQAIPSYDTLDARLSYNFRKLGTNWTIYLQGDDLLRGAKDVDMRRAITSEFTGGDADYYFPRNYQFNGGRTITLGVKARF